MICCAVLCYSVIVGLFNALAFSAVLFCAIHSDVVICCAVLCYSVIVVLFNALAFSAVLFSVPSITVL